MTARADSLTLTEFVRTSLRADILSGKIGRGEPLRLEALMARFDVSRAVVREVLIRLVEENLVVANPNRGFRVIDITAEGLVDLIKLRVLVESEAMKLSIEQGDTEWEAGIIAAHHVLERAEVSESSAWWGESEAWVRAHISFHEALTAACGSPRMLSLVNRLRKESAIYYQVRVPAGSPAAEDIADRDIAAEHSELMHLAIARDGEGAVELFQHETWTTAKVLLQVLESEG
ncbi:GntR family transcriptional regulator [Leucobacter sp. CSA1]|uniref:GntR family transcriptional regulator n=1 Tax=Leucobacter chromiisoli TaxID=2796471 RepID=A0A934QBK5_9MICO|nr:GntR family transcriptional regulator [Leucobacter chromiisoli]MBK0420297.1 GntR family transcriptional regulator [Leucobacter chromiisoli]